MRHEFPENYEPLNYCRGCGNDFTSIENFDRHRIGTHQPMNRRCMTEEEMVEAGLSRVQIGDSPRYDIRLPLGVPLWWDEVAVGRVRLAPPMIRG